MDYPIKIIKKYNFENELVGIFEEALDYYDDNFISNLFKVDINKYSSIRMLNNKKYILIHVNEFGMASYVEYEELYNEFVSFSQENMLGQEYIILLLQMRNVFSINTFLLDRSMGTIKDLNEEIIYAFYCYLFEKDLNLIPLAS